MRAITDTIVAFKLVWLRVACYFIIPFAVTFLSLTEQWTGETWDQTHTFVITRMFVSCFVAGITSFVAYIDSSFQRARNEATEMRQKREAQTDFIAKPKE